MVFLVRICSFLPSLRPWNPGSIAAYILAAEFGELKTKSHLFVLLRPRKMCQQAHAREYDLKKSLLLWSQSRT